MKSTPHLTQPILLYLNRFILIVLICFIVSAFYNPVFSQTSCFYDPGVPERISTCSNSPSDVTHTGNDSRGTMEVNVWDGDYPGLSWYESSGPYQGCIDLPSGINDPDVVYSNDYAIVVYVDNNNNCICDVYYWSGSSFSQYTINGFPYSLQACSNRATYNTSINIDLDENNIFCIVWDDRDESRIIAQGGENSGSYPILAGRAVVVNGYNFQMPDVSLTKRTCSGGCVSQVYCTYVNINNDSLHVDGGHYEDWIASNSCTTTNVHPTRDTIPPLTTTASFLYPRIACHTFDSNSPSTTWLDWAVVVESYDPNNGLDDIVGYRYNNSTPYIAYDNVYTDGISGPSGCAIDNNGGERNQYPVLSFSSDPDKLMIGWQSEFSNDGAFVPNAVAAIMCNGADGSFNNTVCGDWYLIIPEDNSSYSPSAAELYLSLSGRDFSAIHYTFYDDNVPDVLFKEVVYGSTCNLSPFRKKSASINDITLFPNPFLDELNVEISSDDTWNIIINDQFGRILVNVTGIGELLKAALKASMNQIPAGVFTISLNNIVNNTIERRKIIKLNK